MLISIHQVVEISLAEGFFLIYKFQYLLVFLLQLLFFIGKFSALVIAMTYGVNTPIVEDRGASVPAAESLFVHTSFSILLPCIEHEWVGEHQGIGNQRGHSFACIACEEGACYALLVVILQKIQHVVVYVIRGLPFVCYGCCGSFSANHIANAVVHAHLVVKPVEPCSDVVAIFRRIINLTDELHLWIHELHLVGSPRPEGCGHHLRHVATERINTFLCPEQEYGGHLVPCVWNRVEMIRASSCIAIVYAVVQFHRLIPVVLRWTVKESVVACCLGWNLLIGLFCAYV